MNEENRDEAVIAKIVYCIIANIGGELDDIVGKIYDSKSTIELDRISKKIYFAEGLSLVAKEIGEILSDANYEELGDLLCTACYEETSKRTTEAISLLEEERTELFSKMRNSEEQG